LVARKPLTEFSFGRFGYRVEQAKLHDVTGGVTDIPAAVRSLSDLGAQVKSQIFTGVTYDSRDSLFLTRKGERFDLSTFVTGGPLGGDIQIYGWNAEASKYFRFKWDTILTLNAQVGVVDAWGKENKNYEGTGFVPLYDRLFLGGSNDLRGFKYHYVGGKDGRAAEAGACCCELMVPLLRLC
jgi:outer membrane protein insertion porin family